MGTLTTAKRNSGSEVTVSSRDNAAPRETLRFDQTHIDVARNSTDDFNPFHDPLRWSRVAGNPFPAPIALGFQLEFLCSDHIMRTRAAGGPRDDALPFRNFEFNFAGALRAGEPFEVDVRRTIEKPGQTGGLSNRAVIRATDRTPVLLGTQSDTAVPRVDDVLRGARLPSLREVPDRSVVSGTDLFLKRKFLNTSNAKNFCLASLCRQQDYIDELEDRVYFPPLFTASLISCALLERGLAQGHDFLAEPMVYTNHQITVNMTAQRRLRSNAALHLLVAPPQPLAPGGGLGKVCVTQQLFRCAALLDDGTTLFNARVQLAALEALASMGNG